MCLKSLLTTTIIMHFLLTCDVLQFNNQTYSIETFLILTRCQLLCNGTKSNHCSESCRHQYNVTNLPLVSEENMLYPSLLPPVVMCQDLIESAETDLLGKVVLSWDFNEALSEVYNFHLFVVEGAVYDGLLHHFQVLGLAEETKVQIDNMKVAAKYRFRITAVLSFDIVLPPVISEWISIEDVMQNISAPSTVKAVDFRLNSNILQAYINWTVPKELPCSYDILWFPMSGDGLFEQKSIIQPQDTLPVILPNLLFGTTYSIEITPIDPSQKRYVSSAHSHFVTPCAYKRGVDPRLCSIGPPKNLTAVWSGNMSKATVRWSPPPLFSLDFDVELHYSLTVWEEVNDKRDFIQQMFLPGNVTEVQLNLQPFKNYSIGIFATIDMMLGTTAFTELVALESIVKETHTQAWSFVFISAGILLLFAISVLIYFSWKKITRSRKLSLEDSNFFVGNYNVPTHLHPYYVPVSKVKCHEILGQGAFGVVRRGEILKKREKMVVAVKEFLLPFTDDAQMKVLREVELMKILGRHRHIVGLLGFSIAIDRVLLMIEYCPLKDLLSWLTSFRIQLGIPSESMKYEDSGIYVKPEGDIYYSCVGSDDRSESPILEEHWTDLISYMYQVSDAMEHISHHKIIHCDIAARNILMYTSKVVKIADFGLARDIYQSRTYVPDGARRLPIKWMAVETLDRRLFTTWSDIWSFGVLMWEIATFGDHPYSELENEQILHALKQGVRLKRPRYCSLELYEIMSRCWLSNPHRRLTFSELKRRLGRMLEHRENYSHLYPSI